MSEICWCFCELRWDGLQWEREGPQWGRGSLSGIPEKEAQSKHDILMQSPSQNSCEILTQRSLKIQGKSKASVADIVLFLHTTRTKSVQLSDFVFAFVDAITSVELSPVLRDASCSMAVEDTNYVGTEITKGEKWRQSAALSVFSKGQLNQSGSVHQRNTKGSLQNKKENPRDRFAQLWWGRFLSKRVSYLKGHKIMLAATCTRAKADNFLWCGSTGRDSPAHTDKFLGSFRVRSPRLQSLLTIEAR